MSIKTYEISGRMKIKNRWSRFSMTVRALKPEHALEKVFSLLGSRHKLKRFDIKIEEVRELVEVGSEQR
ncbi:MAG: 50S ribosomal protein LX [Candidatus Verstraetearchaeota archaeon]|jgi:large subunit ribosomal protein LX|nr:50S ribosomal protein LX [Candidatus Verstraetearchaeota archaeon]NHW44226.1 50S ribosomal protein LX [Candidatus Verstraetearchaeota archaeon]